MTRSSFETLCGILQNLRRNDSKLREAIPLEKRVAVALYALGSSAEYRIIGNLYGIGKSTVCELVITFCQEAWKCLRSLYMNNFPLTRKKFEKYVKDFEILRFSQCLGAIDATLKDSGCHIEIHPAKEDATDYYNYKGWYSTVLLALVDARYRFIYINVGSPGRCNNSQIYETSQLKQQLQQCYLLEEMSKNISNVTVPVFIIGDSAFRFSRSLMKPFPFHILQSNDEKRYNYALSKTRRVVENAFGHFKARFRRIGKGIDNRLKNTSLIIKTCCVLHNFLVEKKDAVIEKCIVAYQKINKLRNNPENTATIDDNDESFESILQAVKIFLSTQTNN